MAKTARVTGTAEPTVPDPDEVVVALHRRFASQLGWWSNCPSKRCRRARTCAIPDCCVGRFLRLDLFHRSRDQVLPALRELYPDTPWDEDEAAAVMEQQVRSLVRQQFEMEMLRGHLRRKAALARDRLARRAEARRRSPYEAERNTGKAHHG